MAEIKIYYWDDNGIERAIEVTFSKTPCNHVFEGSENRYTTITVSVSELVPVDLPVIIDVEEQWYGFFNNDTYHYFEQIVIPANTLEVSEEKKCVVYPDSSNPEEETNSDETHYTYMLGDQRNIPSGSFEIEHVKTDARGYGTNDGSIIISTLGGTAPYTYTWSDIGEGSKQRLQLPPGLYSVTVTDGLGTIRSIVDIEITEPPEIVADIDITNCKCFGSSTGAITVDVSGGVGGYSFMWSDGVSQLNRNNIPSGNYTLTVTDANNVSKAFVATVSQPTRLVVTANIVGKNVSVTVTGGVAPYLYFWNDGVTVPNRLNLELGTYTVTVRDANGCQALAVVNIDDFKFYFSKNPVWLQLHADNFEAKENLSFLAEVWVEDEYQSGEFTKKYEAEHPANIDGSTVFDFQDVLNAFVKLDVPIYADNQVRRLDGVFKRFYLKHTEKFGNPPVPAGYTTVETFYILLGGLSDQEFAKNTFFESYLDNQKPFLTWEMNRKPTMARSHEYLHFPIVDQLLNEVELWADVTYIDGSSGSNKILSQDGIAAYEVYRFPAGFDQLGLGDFSEKLAVSYDVCLKNALGDVVSEKRTYLLREDSYRNRVFIYENSVGAWATITTFGHLKGDLKTSEESVDRQIQTGYGYSFRERVVTNKSGQLGYKVYVGSLTNVERSHLIDLAISEQVYEVTESGYLPVQIKFDLNILDTLDEVDDISFTVIPPVTRKYTPQL